VNAVLFNPRAAPAHRRLPLSALSIARVLPERHPWELVDGNVDADAEARLDALGARPRTVLLVTVMPGPQLRAATPICRALKAKHPGLLIAWGGYFPTLHPEACAQDAGVDCVVTGPGEGAVVPLLDAIEAGQDVTSVPGVAAWRDRALVRTPPGPPRRSSDFGPFPYARLDMDRYAAPTFLGRRTFNHHSSVGCPYFCNFCAVVPVYQGRWIPDPAEAVLAAARELHERHGADAIEFHDNNFFAWEKRTREVADGLRGLGVAWWGEGRVDTMLGFSGDTWEAMSRGGLKMVFLGAESGDQAALDAMDKGGLEVGDIAELNRVAARHGIVPEFSFVLGNPGDPEGDVSRSLALVRTLKRDNPRCEIILYLYTPVPMPGPLDTARAQGFSFPDTLDGWISAGWRTFDGRRTASTPWMDRGLVRRVYDFEAVLHARYPSVSDRNLRSWQRAVLRVLAEPRWRAAATWRPLGIKALQRAWGYRRPEEMGF
jgi:radical SAM superfamily enzyme YgiQ (UPF0313 family)